MRIIVLKHQSSIQNLYCIKLPFFTKPKSVYSSTPISDAVICTHPQPYFLASSTTYVSSVLAMACLRYSSEVNILERRPIFPLGQLKYGEEFIPCYKGTLLWTCQHLSNSSAQYLYNWVNAESPITERYFFK